ncbi:MAG: PaREP1 family protein [Sulfolobales archaeon]
MYSAATDLSKKLGEEGIRYAWTAACDIHILGFHEAKYRIGDVETLLPLAEWLLNYTKKILGESGKG